MNHGRVRTGVRTKATQQKEKKRVRVRVIKNEAVSITSGSSSSDVPSMTKHSFLMYEKE